MERLELGHDERQWAQHTYRYQVAAGFTTDSDTVLDAACGIGYGKNILKGTWFGADKNPGLSGFKVDLNSWVPDFHFDVFIGLETIEHLDDFTTYVEVAKMARRIVISTPIIPTKHFNPYHLHDFTKESLEELFSDRELLHYEPQIDYQIGLETYGIWAFG